jgi:arginine deiminase
MTQAPVSAGYGVHSEVGRLRKVLVCSPGLAHRRLTPTNSHDLLFDDVMWVENAQRDHADFVAELAARGVVVVELHDLLAETMADPRSSPTRWASAWSTTPGPSSRASHPAGSRST